MLATTAAAAASGSRRSAAAGAKAVAGWKAAGGASRCKSAVAAASSESVKTFKIYRWDPNEKVRHLHDRRRQRSMLHYNRTATFSFMTGRLDSDCNLRRKFKHRNEECRDHVVAVPPVAIQ